MKTCVCSLHDWEWLLTLPKEELKDTLYEASNKLANIIHPYLRHYKVSYTAGYNKHGIARGGAGLAIARGGEKPRCWL